MARGAPRDRRVSGGQFRGNGPGELPGTSQSAQKLQILVAALHRSRAELRNVAEERDEKKAEAHQLEQRLLPTEASEMSLREESAQLQLEIRKKRPEVAATEAEAEHECLQYQEAMKRLRCHLTSACAEHCCSGPALAEVKALSDELASWRDAEAACIGAALVRLKSSSQELHDARSQCEAAEAEVNVTYKLYKDRIGGAIRSNSRADAVSRAGMALMIWAGEESIWTLPCLYAWQRLARIAREARSRMDASLAWQTKQTQAKASVAADIAFLEEHSTVVERAAEAQAADASSLHGAEVSARLAMEEELATENKVTQQLRERLQALECNRDSAQKAAETEEVQLEQWQIHHQVLMEELRETQVEANALHAEVSMLRDRFKTLNGSLSKQDASEQRSKSKVNKALRERTLVRDLAELRKENESLCAGNELIEAEVRQFKHESAEAKSQRDGAGTMQCKGPA
eukprot:gnl/MRDRNA2_/MRDRNA2_158894_c0_seq1.p1 gnl/MRDRNA2_/MRDRNA2_158894_c0~~gnl/MRDRNA2_/MRDRNA2_158894_c0_seq1.p1  ORF type:complete len:460 (+),score=137.14 gnl/MRDRNA2_/MRDRNA2_158894_c0_seq1:2-1381(+)